MLMRATDSVLLLVDLQERLVPAIEGGEALLGRCRILLEAAARLAVPIILSEQYPRGLGPTVGALLPLPDGATVLDKTHFSCAAAPNIREHLGRLGRRHVILAGVEAHVCVLQTALDLVEAGYRVATVADATGSRRKADRRLALARMRGHGVDIVSSEMVLFEWLHKAGTPEFREISRLIK